MAVIVITFLLLLPLHLLLEQSPLLWIFSIMTKDINTVFNIKYLRFKIHQSMNFS